MKVIIVSLFMLTTACATSRPEIQYPDGYTEEQKQSYKEQHPDAVEQASVPTAQQGPSVGQKILLGIGAGLQGLGSAFKAQQTAPAPVRMPVRTNCTQTGFGNMAQVNCTSY